MQFSRPLDAKPARVTRSSHHVCFSCRKTFKKPASTKDGFVTLSDQTYPCPNCQKPMTPIGKNFRAPKQNNLRAWRLAERLYQSGFRFNSSLEGNVPTHPSDLKNFLATKLRKTNAERLLERFLDHKHAPSCSWNSTSRATRAVGHGRFKGKT